VSTTWVSPSISWNSTVTSEWTPPSSGSALHAPMDSAMTSQRAAASFDIGSGRYASDRRSRDGARGHR